MRDYTVEFFIGLGALAVGSITIMTLMSNLNALNSTCLIAGGFLTLFVLIVVLDSGRDTSQERTSLVARDVGYPQATGTDDSADYEPYNNLSDDEENQDETPGERLSPHGAKIISRRPM